MMRKILWLASERQAVKLAKVGQASSLSLEFGHFLTSRGVRLAANLAALQAARSAESLPSE